MISPDAYQINKQWKEPANVLMIITMGSRKNSNGLNTEDARKEITAVYHADDADGKAFSDKGIRVKR